jgi:hypothetical protein
MPRERKPRLAPAEPADARRQTEMRAPVPSWRRRHSEIGTVSVAPQAARSSRDAVRGVGTHGVDSSIAEADAGEVRLQRSRGRLTGRSRAGRQATRGVRRTESIEAGDGLTAMPLLLLRSAARTAGVERETPKHAR